MTMPRSPSTSPPSDDPAPTVSMQRAALLTGLAQHTLRWYERVGLVPDVERCATGQRRYSRSNLDWIAILRALRATGMPVATLKELTLHDSGGVTERPLRIVQLHRAQLLVLMAQLHRSLVVLDRVEDELAPTRSGVTTGPEAC